LLGIGESTLNEILARGEIDYIKIGTRVLFRPQFLINFLEKHTVNSRASGALRIA